MRNEWRIVATSLVAVGSLAGDGPELAAPPPVTKPASDWFATRAGYVMTSYCHGACADELARITVWRSREGKPGLLEFQGSLTACSHPPGALVQLDGSTWEIPNRPVVRGSPEEREIAARRAALTKGLEPQEKHTCRDLLAP